MTISLQKPEEALEAASNSIVKIHFISTINPLAKDEEVKAE
ncbi:MAG: hypothetical protein ACYTXE_25495 [Nostoc sp.]